jgi:SAM-dependent methyltransferase
VVDSFDWRKFHAGYKVKKIPKDFFLMDVLKKYLPLDGSCIELGSSPGRYLTALSRNFNYDLTGIDICNIELTKKTLKHNSIGDVNILKGNIINYKPKKQYDIVVSFGLIEHFKDPEQAFIHFDKFCKNEGYIVIGIPNYRYFFKIIRRLLGPHVYHNSNIMDLKKINNIVSSKYDLIYLNYYSRFYSPRFLINDFSIPWLKSRFISPYIIYIGKKYNRN